MPQYYVWERRGANLKTAILQRIAEGDTHVIDHLGVGSVGAELVEDEGREQSHVARHLLHPPQLTLLFCVRELDH